MFPIVLNCALFLSIFLVGELEGHGMMLEPPNRSSLWRYNSSAPINYNDNQNFCGGFSAQWETFGGKCGVCGDRYDDPHPQNNENTGKYGQGNVVREYKSGSIIDTKILLTANHKGFFTYSLCVLKDANQPEQGEDCFKNLKLVDGTTKFKVKSSDHLVKNKVALPDKIKCDRCVLRWHYTAGNNWGFCQNGSSGVGCGPQETFRSCSDIRII